MRHTPNRIMPVLFSLAVACGLAFGAQSAFANGSQGSNCVYNPSNGYLGLSCTVGPAGDEYCDQECKRRMGPDHPGHCMPWVGCCLCAI